jgi:hypothetical protein
MGTNAGIEISKLHKNDVERPIQELKSEKYHTSSVDHANYLNGMKFLLMKGYLYLPTMGLYQRIISRFGQSWCKFFVSICSH